VDAAKPVLVWENRTGVTTQTYVPALSKYLTVISTPTDSPQTQANFTTYILESDLPTGYAPRSVQFRSDGSQFDFVRLSARVPHGAHV